MIFMVILSILNMIGICLWGATMIMAMDVIYGKNIHELDFRRIFTRNVCVAFARLRRRLSIDHKYSGSILIFMGAIIAIFLKLTELSEVIEYNMLRVIGRVFTSLFIPFGIIILYKASGYRISFLNKD